MKCILGLMILNMMVKCNYKSLQDYNWIHRCQAQYLLCCLIIEDYNPMPRTNKEFRIFLKKLAMELLN
ncbi:unnamed protein product [Paramecium primaurelia]|uniref:Uncharacterized protein n=1 Tax=Paramecium primaurelia TaxID=5886 RepID=A0A8S1JQX1_PARPR|nr:unnamed protein product [Paramecium primaurelia]